MRWDFFRYLLDIQGLTVSGSKEGTGEKERELASQRDKDKSQPQLISARSLHNQHHQLILSISPSTSRDGTDNSINYRQTSFEEVDANKSTDSLTNTSTNDETLDKCSPSISLSVKEKYKLHPSADSLPQSPFLTKSHENGNIAALANGNPHKNFISTTSTKRDRILLSSSPASTSSWKRNGDLGTSIMGNSSTANDHSIKSSLTSSPTNQCLIENTKPPIKESESWKIVTVNINCHHPTEDMKGNTNELTSELNGNVTEEELQRSSCGNACSNLVNINESSEQRNSPYKNGPIINNGNDVHCHHHPDYYHSLSSSTDANNAEAEVIMGRDPNNRNVVGVPAMLCPRPNEISTDPATEDEASSITSSPSTASSSTKGDNDEEDENVEVKTVSGNGNKIGISNSAENHNHLCLSGEKPLAVYSPCPVVSSTSYNTLRWTKAVANQENLAAYTAQNKNLRYAHTHHHPQSFYSPQGKCKGAVEANNENVVVSTENEFTRTTGSKKSASISNTIRAGTIVSSSSLAAVNAPIIQPVNECGKCNGSSSLLVSTRTLEQKPRARSTSIIGGNNVCSKYSGATANRISLVSGDSSGVESANNTLLVFHDKWRVLFDKFDREGFGEITWADFFVALRSKEFQTAIEPGKLQLLEDLARVHSTQTNSITFQLFVNIMTGKRSRSFKCAVHHRDREVCSESDFHLLPLGYQSPTGVKRMAKLIADEFLTDERDRKYYADHYRCIPPPLFIISITLIELGFFTYYTVWHGEISSSGPLPMDSPFVYRPDKRQEVWRFLFYMVLHAGWVHLMFNLLVQLLVGLPLEMVHGSLRIGCVYMAGVLAGSLGTSVFDPDVYLVGASGGVYALLAAHLANVLLNYNNMEFGLVRLLGVFLIASVDVGFAIYDRYAASPPLTEGSVPPVSYVAHLTGALAGLTIGLLVLKNFEQKLREQLMWWLALGVYAACTLFAILFNIFHPVYPEMIPTDFVEIPEKFPHHQMQ